jgi:hypothetical protein
VTMRVGTSAVIEACSTHGRVPSAARTWCGQPTSQDIPGTLSVTIGGFVGVSVCGCSTLIRCWSGFLPHPIRASPITTSEVIRNAILIGVILLWKMPDGLVRGSFYGEIQARLLFGPQHENARLLCPYATIRSIHLGPSFFALLIHALTA